MAYLKNYAIRTYIFTVARFHDAGLLLRQPEAIAHTVRHKGQREHPGPKDEGVNAESHAHACLN